MLTADNVQLILNNWDKLSEQEKEIVSRESKKLLDLLENRNEIYAAYREFRGRYAILIGGSGSGKSYEVADKHIDRLVEESNHRILCCRAEQKQISESQVPIIASRIAKRYDTSDWKINLSKGHESITYLPNGNQFIFWGLDDVNKLKSIFDITSIWVEEADQTDEASLRELDRRLRGYKGVNNNGIEKYMQITLTFNPVSILSWLKIRFFDNKDKNQLMLCGQQPFTDCINYELAKYTLNRKVIKQDEQSGKEVETYEINTLVMHTTYLDNKFIDDNYHFILMEMKETAPEEFNIYALGQWGISGGTYFDKSQINLRISQAPKPIKKGYFEYKIGFNDDLQIKTIEKMSFIEDSDGYISIYSEVDANAPYVLSGDTAGDGSDWNTGILTDNRTGHEVASVRIQMDEDLYAHQMLCLGIMYNKALIGIETNYSTRPMKIISTDFGYINCYAREERPDSYTQKYVKKIGFWTDKLTRPNMLGMLRTLVREEVYKINSIQTLQEMTTFVKNEKGKPEAKNGFHDDMIMAWAINLAIKHQQSETVSETEYDINWDKVPDDIREDFDKANEAMQSYMINHWRENGYFRR